MNRRGERRKSLDQNSVPIAKKTLILNKQQSDREGTLEKRNSGRRESKEEFDFLISLFFLSKFRILGVFFGGKVYSETSDSNHNLLVSTTMTKALFKMVNSELAWKKRRRTEGGPGALKKEGRKTRSPDP